MVTERRAQSTDYLSQDMLPAISCVKVVDRDSILERLVERGLWIRLDPVVRLVAGKRKTDKQGKTAGFTDCVYFPKLMECSDMSLLCPEPARDVDGDTFPEGYSKIALETIGKDLPSLTHNMMVRRNILDGEHNALWRKKGQKSKDVIIRMEYLERSVEKINRQSEGLAKAMSASGAAGEDASLTHENVGYHRTLAPTSRRYVNVFGAQHLSRVALEALLPHTIDLDFASSMFRLVVPMVGRLKWQSSLTELKFTHVKAVAENRAKVIQNDLTGVSLPDGKELLNSITSGGSIPTAHAANEFLKGLKKESMLLRWISSAMLLPLLRELRRDDKRKYPEATVFHVWSTATESACLDAWVEMIKSHPTKHLSLHFDGVRIDTDRVPVSKVAEFIEASERHIYQATGYVVNIVRKEHESLLMLLRKRASETHDVGAAAAELDKDGNGIPRAIHRLHPEAAADVMRMVAAKNAKNEQAQYAGVRARFSADV